MGSTLGLPTPQVLNEFPQGVPATASKKTSFGAEGAQTCRDSRTHTEPVLPLAERRLERGQLNDDHGKSIAVAVDGWALDFL
jgi:hypothetical protein